MLVEALISDLSFRMAISADSSHERLVLVRMVVAYAVVVSVSTIVGAPIVTESIIIERIRGVIESHNSFLYKEIVKIENVGTSV